MSEDIVSSDAIIYRRFLFPAGRYIYFDASQREGTARFVTPSNINSYACLTFYYHMMGMHVGRLNVYTKNLRGNEKLLWRLFGDQTDEWKEAKLPIDDIHEQYQVNTEICRMIRSMQESHVQY